MSGQEKKQPNKKTSDEKQTSIPPKDMKATGDELKKKIADVLDDIEEVLEENAEEMVAGFVQRGGQ